MKKLKILKQVGYHFEPYLDNFQISFNINYSNRNDVEDYIILTYLKSNWYLIENLKFSYGGVLKSIYSVTNLDRDVKILTDIEVRDLKLELFIQD